MDTMELEAAEEAKRDAETPKRIIDREIFVWNCRGVLRKSDPMAIQRRMAEEADRLNVDPVALHADLVVATAELKSLTDEDKRKYELEAHRAHGALAAIARAGFGLKGIEDDEENGWTEAELLELLQRFWKWCAELKKNANGSSSSPSTAE